MPLLQARHSTKETFETSSIGAPQITLEKPWVQFQQRTEGASWAEDSDAKGTIVTSLDEEYSTRAEVLSRPSDNRKLDEEYSTRAERRELSEREQIFRKWQEDIYPSLSEAFTEKLQRIAEREDDWDGKGSLKPNIVALSKAHITLERFLKAVINNGRLWKTPFVSSDEDGHITIQWNSGGHELHIEIGEEGTEYLKVWGVNIEREMHLGILKGKEFLNLWDWLTE